MMRIKLLSRTTGSHPGRGNRTGMLRMVGQGRSEEKKRWDVMYRATGERPTREDWLSGSESNVRNSAVFFPGNCACELHSIK